jgi:dCMP deaminase
MAMAQEVAKMGTCARRQVGALLVDSRNIILSTGLNGVPSGFDHCRDNPGHECPGATAKSGTNLDACSAIHAEMNCIISCPDILRAATCYSTTSPCVSCTKALLNTGVTRIVFVEEYPQPEAAELWTRHNFVERDRARMTVRVWRRTWERWDPASGRAEVVKHSDLLP